MHGNQPPNYPPGGGGNPNQAPNYPGGPGGPPGGPNYPSGFPFPIYQAGMPQPYMPPTTPQYPQAGAPGAIPHNFMNVQTSSVKPEPVWNPDRYGMPGPSAGPFGYPGMGAGIEDPRNVDIFSDAPVLPYQPPTPQVMHNPSQSLLAQHLANAPLPPAAQSSQPTSHLSQLLQQPTYPGGGMTSQMQQQMIEQRMQQMQAMRHQQQAYQAQQEYIAQQQQQMTRAAQLQAEQAAAAAALSAVSSTSLLPPLAQGFPPSASSSHSAYSRQHEVQLAHHHIPLMVRDSPHQPDVDLEKFTTGELCQYGRELANELNAKTSQLSFVLKKVMELKCLSQGENPTELSEHCRYNLQRMVEIRQIIESRREPEWKRMTGDDYIELMLDDSELDKPMDEKRRMKRAELEKRFPNIMSKTPPNEGDVLYQGRWISEALHKKYMKFEANKASLTSLASQLKALAWKIDVTSPMHLKKVDQTKISKKRENEPTATH